MGLRVKQTSGSNPVNHNLDNFGHFSLSELRFSHCKVEMLISQGCRESRETVCVTVPGTELPLLSFPSQSAGWSWLVCFILPKPEEWTQLRSLPLNAILCLLPRASSSKFSGHTGGAKAFPEAEVIKQEKTKLCFQRAGLVGYEHSHLSVTNLSPEKLRVRESQGDNWPV